MERPSPSEHHEYYSTYINQVPAGDIIEILRGGIDQTAALLAGRPASIGDHRYAPGKWTIREVLGHLSDCERTFGFRAFWFARKGAGELPSLDQEPFVAESSASTRSVTNLLDEWRDVRRANISLFETIGDEASKRTGIASGRSFSVRSFAWIIAGHEIHHRRQLAEQYLRG
jgi:hypothetical protein